MILALGCALIIFGIAFLFFCGYLQERGVDVPILVGLAGGFGSLILAVVLLYSILGECIVLDVEERSRRYEAQRLARLHNVGWGQVLEAFRAQGFRDAGEGYLERRLFTPAKDFIHYYVRCVPAEDVEAALSGELARFERLLEGDQKAVKKNICLYLFLYKDRVTEADEKPLQEADTAFLLGETVVPTRVFQTCVAVLADAAGEGRFLDMSKGISVYAHACRRLKKYFPSRV